MVKLFFVILMKKWLTISDEYAPEHLEVQTENLKWFHERLTKLWIFICWRRNNCCLWR
jgi:histidinol dehydrogenase